VEHIFSAKSLKRGQFTGSPPGYHERPQKFFQGGAKSTFCLSF